MNTSKQAKVTQEMFYLPEKNHNGGAAMQARLGKLETDVGVLKTDVEVLKSDVRVLKSDVQVLKSDVHILKTDVQELKIDVAVIKSNYATKTDIIDAKNRIIVWVVSALFLAQLFPYLIKALAA